MSDFEDLTIKQALDLGNKIGGQTGAKRIMSGELVLIERSKLNQDADVRRWIKINETIFVVDLGAAPSLPFKGAEIEQRIGECKAILEKRVDGLYLSARKVVLHLSNRQMNGKWLRGYELREELTGKPVLNANVLDALYENPHLIPEDWKKDEAGNIRHIFFWGTIFRSSGTGDLCVRCLCFRGGAWHLGCYWLGHGWHVNYPSAVLASN